MAEFNRKPQGFERPPRGPMTIEELKRLKDLLPPKSGTRVSSPGVPRPVPTVGGSQPDTLAGRIAEFEGGNIREGSPFARQTPRQPLESTLRAADRFIGEPLDAFAESTFRGATFQDQVEAESAKEFFQGNVEAFNERNIFAQLAIGGLISPEVFASRLPSTVLRAAPRGRFGLEATEFVGRSGGLAEGPAVRQLTSENIPPSVRPEPTVRQLTPEQIPPSVRPKQGGISLAGDVPTFQAGRFNVESNKASFGGRSYTVRSEDGKIDFDILVGQSDPDLGELAGDLDISIIGRQGILSPEEQGIIFRRIQADFPDAKTVEGVRVSQVASDAAALPPSTVTAGDAPTPVESIIDQEIAELRGQFADIRRASGFQSDRETIALKIERLTAEKEGRIVGRVFTEAEFEAGELAERGGTTFADDAPTSLTSVDPDDAAKLLSMDDRLKTLVAASNDPAMADNPNVLKALLKTSGERNKLAEELKEGLGLSKADSTPDDVVAAVRGDTASAGDVPPSTVTAGDAPISPTSDLSDRTQREIIEREAEDTARLANIASEQEITRARMLKSAETARDEEIARRATLSTAPDAPTAASAVPDIRLTVPEVPAGTTTRVLQPMSSEVETTLSKLVAQAEEVRPAREVEQVAGLERRSVERGTRVGNAQRLKDELIASGMPAREAGARANALLAGELPGPVFNPLDITRDEIAPLFTHNESIPNRKFFEASNTRVSLEKVLSGQMPAPAELESLRKVFGNELVEALTGKRIRAGGTDNLAIDALNAPRQILTAYDLSAPLRQGVVLLPRHPGEWGKSVGTMMKALVSDSAAIADDAARKADPNWIRFTERHAPGDSKNLFQADLSNGITSMNRREEQFMSRLANAIPGVRQSQRAYVTFLNKLRFDVMSNVVKGWENAGHVVTETDLDELALFLNRATGRGSLGTTLNKSAPFLNTLFFSPRLLVSRPQVLGSANPFGPSKLARQQAQGDLVAFVGTGLSILGIAHLAGAEVEGDPRSSDFGKIKLGNTTIDFWGGFQSLARYGAQFVTGQSKTITGRNRGNINDIPRLSLEEFQDPVWLRFTRSKLSPGPGFIADETVFGQENFLGDPTFGHEDFGREDILPEIGERGAPLFFQDLLDALRDDRAKGIFKALPAFFGAGVTTFERE